ncbi:predicted protein [Histoplasma capsulatum G186AR]|uniref:Uncharacterized protein n=1 Tax=Ajellomyces capsulatus (strain G186AR / H82 / ATCC MYA-2454 / RMSCC 2432) TaxID=447093 RepID=C0NYT7_AJECG|nr:uncharacterized protein HCBG_08317 [Histoplasma capsulatum G186AR]EEH03377.1 predicted protein [Histoplasma capsulatum G186AR]
MMLSEDTLFIMKYIKSDDLSNPSYFDDEYSTHKETSRQAVKISKENIDEYKKIHIYIHSITIKTLRYNEYQSQCYHKSFKIFQEELIRVDDNSLNSMRAEDKIDEEMSIEEEVNKYLNTVESYTLMYKEYLRWKKEVAAKVLLNTDASTKYIDEGI